MDILKIKCYYWYIIGYRSITVIRVREQILNWGLKNVTLKKIYLTIIIYKYNIKKILFFLKLYINNNLITHTKCND